MKVSSFKLTHTDLHTNSVEYSISIDTNYYGFNAEQLKQLFIAQSHNLSAKEKIDENKLEIEQNNKIIRAAEKIGKYIK